MSGFGYEPCWLRKGWPCRTKKTTSQAPWRRFRTRSRSFSFCLRFVTIARHPSPKRRSCPVRRTDLMLWDGRTPPSIASLTRQYAGQGHPAKFCHWQIIYRLRILGGAARTYCTLQLATNSNIATCDISRQCNGPSRGVTLHEFESRHGTVAATNPQCLTVA